MGTLTRAAARGAETVHAFAGNPIVAQKRDAEQVSQWFLSTPDAATHCKVLPFRDGKPLVATGAQQPWSLAWLPLEELEWYREERDNQLVYLGDGDGDDGGESTGCSYFAIAVPKEEESQKKLLFGREMVTFFDLRSLMQAAEYGDEGIMGELSIAGHARAMLEWHKQASFCGRCGSSSRPILCGQRRQCSNVKCNNKLYPRLDPVVIMLVIDKERDCAILGRQSRFVPRMWSCIAGFIEPGESLEEAVRRETREEVGLEVGDIVYHSSQPWPMGPSSMPCQLMVGFFAYAKSFDIRVDKKELEDAQWHRREDVRKILENTRYKRDQQEALVKLQKSASGDTSRTKPSSSSNGNGSGNEMSFVPGPYAIAHHLISTWAYQGPSLTQSNI